MNIFDMAQQDLSSFSENEIELTAKSPYCLVVPMEFKAVDAVRLAEMNGIKMICVVESQDRPVARGLVALDWSSKQVTREENMRPWLLSEELGRVESETERDVGELYRQWTLMDRPGIGWCSKHSHLAELPCELP